MGFPLILYLSRSKVVSVWPELGRKKQGDTLLQGVKSTLNLSLTPKIDVVAEWKRRADAPPPTRNNGEPWPPWDSGDIAIAIEKLLRETSSVGSMTEFLKGTFDYPTYKLSGTITIDEDQDEEFHFGGRHLSAHALSGKLKLSNSNAEVSVTLALENIAGVDFKDGHWDVWESGAIHFFRGARASGTGWPLAGLFTYESASADCFAACGIVYFASLTVFEHDRRFLPTEKVEAIAAGIDVWPSPLG